MEYKIKYAEDLIQKEYGVIVKVGSKKKTLSKFGRNDSLTNSSFTLISQNGQETLPTGNVINTISSSETGDTQEVVVEGHVTDGEGNLTFVTQIVTLQGRAAVSLPTQLNRATRLYNNSNTDFSGAVYVYETDTVINGVPQTASKIHILATGTDNQSLKCATSISSKDFWIINQILVSANRQQSAAVDFRIQVRLKNKVFRTVLPLSVHSSTGTTVVNLDIPIIVPPNSDVRVIAQASLGSIGATATLNGYLAEISN